MSAETRRVAWRRHWQVHLSAVSEDVRALEVPRAAGAVRVDAQHALAVTAVVEQHVGPHRRGDHHVRTAVVADQHAHPLGRCRRVVRDHEEVGRHPRLLLAEHEDAGHRELVQPGRDVSLHLVECGQVPLRSPVEHQALLEDDRVTARASAVAGQCGEVLDAVEEHAPPAPVGVGHRLEGTVELVVHHAHPVGGAREDACAEGREVRVGHAAAVEAEAADARPGRSPVGKEEPDPVGA